MTDDAVMDNFLYLKRLIAKYGVDRTADLRVLADRLVKQGEFPNRRAAIRAIETQMGLKVTP